MYKITELANGTWHCELMVQDGYERWQEKSKTDAVFSMIKAARVLNNSYIHEYDISYRKQDHPVPTVHYEGDEKLLKDIRTGHKKVLPFDHYFFKYGITEEEAQTIVKIREGDLKVIQTCTFTEKPYDSV